MSTTPPPPAGGGRDQRVVFVTNVHEDVKEANLEELFSICGNVAAFKKQWDPATKMFGWEVEFAKVSGAQRAAALHGKALVGQALEVTAPGVPQVEMTKRDVGQLNRNTFLNEAMATAMMISQGINYKQEMLIREAQTEANRVLQTEDNDSDGEANPTARTVHVTGFDAKVSERQILNILSACGPVSRIRTGSMDNRHQYSFVEFLKKSSVPAAIALTGTEVTPTCRLSVTRAIGALPPMDAPPPKDDIRNLLSRIEQAKAGTLEEGPQRPDRSRGGDGRSGRRSSRRERGRSSSEEDARYRRERRGGGGGRRRRVSSSRSPSTDDRSEDSRGRRRRGGGHRGSDSRRRDSRSDRRNYSPDRRDRRRR